MDIEVPDIPDLQASPFDLFTQAHEILIGRLIRMYPDGDVFCSQLLYELEIFVSGIRSQLNCDLYAWGEVVEFRCALLTLRQPRCSCQGADQS